MSDNLAIWKRLGVTIAKWADANFLYGIGQLTTDVARIVQVVNIQGTRPLNWNYPFHEWYMNERDVLWITDPDGQRTYLPQTLFVGPQDIPDESVVSILIDRDEFLSPIPIRGALDFYLNDAKQRQSMLFDGELARLIDWDFAANALTFQECSYFDYLQTNLAMDMPVPILGSLRQMAHPDGKLESLRESKLANPTGINGLVFTNDGYMVFQKRLPSVSIRAGELCSGFSGSLDKDDIVHVVYRSGKLSDLDVCRELREELGVKEREISERRFLGITRELTRGGLPEVFYSVNLRITAQEVLKRIPRDKEGQIQTVFLGNLAFGDLDADRSKILQNHFWDITTMISSEGDGPISIPFLTNLTLWCLALCPSYAGKGTP